MKVETIATLALTVQRWGLYALVLVLPLSAYWRLSQPIVPEIHPLYSTLGLYLTDVVVGVVLLATFIANPGRGGQGRWTLPLMGLVALALLTVPLALSPPLALFTASQWVLAVALYVVLSQSDVPVPRIVGLFLMGLGFQVLVGLGQVVRQGPLGFPGEMALASGQMGASIIEVEGARWLRAYGLTFHPNVLGGFLSAGLLLGLPLLERLWARCLWWLLWLGLLLTFSRSAWVATALALPLTVGWLVWQRQPLRRALAQAFIGVGAVIVAGALLWPEQVATRWQPLIEVLQPGAPASGGTVVFSAEQTSLDARVAMNRLAREVALQRPFTGIGAGNFPLAMWSSTPDVPPQFVHNVPLLLAAEVGVLAGAIWLGMAVAALWHLARRRGRLGQWEVVALCAWLALFVVGLFDSYPWSLNAGRLLTVLVLALSRKDDSPQEELSP
ncbi:MAG TPA: O-antigen ligase family protein [Ardenticatenaceae bacterium]|jgi:O-antigen ligase